ncbi:MAG: FAD-binding protein [Proteobacteria bacterium]|nr:MAG: FAD-binding protein [Pseudomonadota bacterium]QKK11771.1 MAG: FAD-binding protein [Pseudomonadota bacterium]
MKIREFATDVLIIGGGLAGTNAALGAADSGASVIVLDKSNIDRSGDIGGGVDHFLAYLNTGPAWDTEDAFLSYVEKIGRGTNHLGHIQSLYCAELPAAIERMARIGNPMTQPDGTFYRTQSMGQPGPMWINFNGKRLKPKLGKAVREAGCKVFGRIMTVDLLTRDGQVVGAIGYQVRTGDFFVFKAKSTIVATGNTNRLYENPRLNPFNTWLCPYNTGDGQMMAFKAGAALTNMEYMRMTILPKGFAAPGFNALVGMGGRFMNSMGDYYMEKSHPQGNRAPRYAVVFNTLNELRNGRGPVYVDCTHLPSDEMRHLQATLSYDKDTLPEYFDQRGEDIATKPIEIMVSEGMQAGPTEVTGSGIKIDGEGATTVPGLYACGDSADHNRCVHGAVTGGYKAGKSAAAHALRTRLGDSPDAVLVRETADRFVAPLHRKSGVPYRQIEDTVRKIMSEHVGPARTEVGLKTGLEKLGKLETHFDSVKVDDLHDLMRVNETRNLLAVGKIMAHSALFRTESRNKPYHYRLDYPETDDKNWCGLVVVKQAGASVECDFERITYSA